jgi:prepilin-type N-terminal cleavage/methylation domain-containing protein
MRRPKSTSTSYTRQRYNRGFSLIELLVVVAVILIVAAIAIPNFIQSRMRANESSAVQSLRNISTAQVVYSSTYGMNYAANLMVLSGNGINPTSSAAGLIDDALASGHKSGYVFTYTPLLTDAFGNPITYSLAADPQASGSSGQRHFYTDQTCVIRSNLTVAAGPSDPPIN